jgi:hypothetical protein
MSTIARPRAIFDTERKDVPGVLYRAQAMHDSIELGAAMFPGLPITMVAFLALLTALSVVQASLRTTSATGLATLRNTKRDALWTAMELVRGYVQSRCDVLPAEGACSLIQAAGLVVAASTVGTAKAILGATLAPAPGTARLAANRRALLGPADARKLATFRWQWSSNGQDWNDAAPTPYASTEITGLAPMTTYFFRVAVTVGRNVGAWSEAVSLLIIR